MGYYHIENLYKNPEILNFKECYAMEKIDGTSAHISFKSGQISFFSGGVKHVDFVKLFNQNFLITKLKEMVPPDVSICIFGEAYGGSCQKMSKTYGNNLHFIAFEVKIGYSWLNVPQAENFCKELGLEFVYYTKIPTTLEALNRERDADSEQAIRNGKGAGLKREGIVLRPLEEYTRNDGRKIIAKYKREEFKETTTSRNVGDRLQKLTEAKAIVDEWVTEERLNHILNAEEIPMDYPSIGLVIKRMIDDITREGKDEVDLSGNVVSAIGTATALMFKRRLPAKLERILEDENSKT